MNVSHGISANPCVCAALAWIATALSFVRSIEALTAVKSGSEPIKRSMRIPFNCWLPFGILNRCRPFGIRSAEFREYALMFWRRAKLHLTGRKHLWLK